MEKIRLVVVGIFAVLVICLTVLIATTVLTLASAAALRAVYPAQYSFVRSDDGLWDKVLNWAYLLERASSTSDGQLAYETGAAKFNEVSIESWIHRCTAEIVAAQTDSARADARFGSGKQRDSTTYEFQKLELVLPVASQILMLSQNLSVSRANNARNASEAYQALQLFTWVTVFLGLATTVLVSLGSTEFGKGDSRTARSIRVLSIIFPAISTAAAAVTTFYSPREDLVRSSQALSSFRQIHEQIASEISLIRCPLPKDADAEKDVRSHLISWSRAVRDARVILDSAAIAAVDPARGQSKVADAKANNGPQGP